jgi:eukaryotic-like serine/threonine-protein kinase
MLKPVNTANLSFTIGDEIGHAGQNSKVFKAVDIQLNAEMVVKRIPKQSFSDVNEYFTEASLLYLSAHPNVAPIHYACQDEEHIFLAMPFYRKGSLKSRMSSSPMTIREIVIFSTQMLSGIHNIHSKGLIHFDIKPDNVLLSDRGEALLSDFGLAKQTSYSGIAGQDRIYGKMVPPEAFGNEDFTKQFDIYQVGLTMHRMCVGDQKFYEEYDSFMVGGQLDRDSFRFAVRNGQFPNRDQYPEHIPQKLVNAIRKCLQGDLNVRYKSAIDVVNDISDIEDVLLDWSMERNGQMCKWLKRLGDGREYQITVNGDQTSHACQRSVNGSERRIADYCSDNLNRASLKRFLREH